MSPRNHSGLGVMNQHHDEDVSVPVFDLFSKSPETSSMKEYRSQIYYSVTPLSHDGPFEFRVTTSADEFLHTPFIRLGGAFQVVRQDGGHLTEKDDVSVVNLAPDSLWRSIAFEIDNVKIEDSSYHYGFKAYFEKMLSQSIGAKYTHLRNDFFKVDKNGSMDVYSKEMSKDSGYLARAESIKQSKLVYFNCTLALDICGISSPLPPNTTYTLKLTRNEDQFTLLSSSKDYKILIPELYLEVLKIIPSTTLLGQIEKRFSSTPLKYELTRSKIQKYSIPSGVFDASQHALFDRGELPRFIMIALTPQAAVSGSSTLNPFNFQHYQLSEVCLTKNNIPIPSTPFKPVWSKNNFARLYRAFYDNLGFYHGASSNGITPEMFQDGCFLIPFDLTPDRCNGFHKHTPESGAEIGLRLYFSKETHMVLSLIVYSVFESSFTIDRQNGVEVGYTL